MIGLKWFKLITFCVGLLTLTLQSSQLYNFDTVTRSLLYRSTRYLVGFVCQVNSSAVIYTLIFVKKNNRHVSWQSLRTDERAFLDREMLSTCRQIFNSRIGNPMGSIFYSMQLQQNQTTCSSSSLNSASLGFLRTILRGSYVCSEGGNIQVSEGSNSKLCISGQGLRRVCTVTFPVLGTFSFNLFNVNGGQEETPTPTPRSQLSRFSGEFNRLAAARLLSKIGLGATKPELDQAIRMGLDNFVNKLVDDCNLNIQTSRARQLEPIARNIRKSLAAPHRTSREAVNYYEKPDQTGNFAGYERDTISSLNNYLYFHFLNGSPVCASMWVILHNWFALQHDALSIDQYPALTGDYVDLIFKNLVGSFEELLKGMHSNAHMLVWLDNHLNRVKCAANGNPTTGVNCFTANQNYAREVMELFTIGTNDIFRPRSDGGIDQGAVNYTELDVEHLTRAAVGPERVVLSADFSGNGTYPGPARRNHSDTSFCSYRSIRIQRGRDTLIDIYPLRKYSSSCINITGLRESRFGFNYSNWVFGERSREFDPLNREFYRGVYLFSGTPWAVGSPDHRVQLNLNTFKCRNYGDQNQNTELPCQFFFNHSSVTSVPRNVTFQTGSEVVTDNLTQILLYHHAYFPGKGSSAARKLAIQLLGYFIGHRAANTPSLVYELAETLVQNRFDLGATLKVLLKSEAIFSEEHHKTAFKTPFEWSLKIARVLRLPQMYYYTNGGHTYFTSIRWIDEISRQTGFPNLDLPSVFGVPVAGIQRNTMSSDGRGFAGPVQYLLRARLLNLLQRYLFVHYTRGAAPQMDPSSSDSVLGSYTIQEGPENVLVYRTQPDPWGWNGDANPDIRYLIYGNQYPQFFGFDITENQRRYAPYSGQMFNWLDYLRENAVLSSVTSAQIDPSELIDELALMFGVSLTSQQKEELLNFFTRLQPQNANSCWGNFRDILAQDGLRSTMSRTEAEKRYFSLKFWGLVYALALNAADSWTK